MVLCTGLLVGCDKEEEEYEPIKPPIEEPEQPVTPPSTDDIIKTKVEIKSGNGKYGAIELIDKRFREFGVEERSQRKPE